MTWHPRRLGWQFASLLPPGMALGAGLALLLCPSFSSRVGSFVLAGGGLAAIAVLGWLFVRHTLRPLWRIEAALARPGDAGHPVRAHVRAPAEIADLAQHLNLMVAERACSAAQLRLAASVFEATSEGILIVSPTLAILEANEAFQRMSRYGRDELVGRNPRMLQSGRQDAALYAAMWNALLTCGQWRGQLWDRRRDGTVFTALVTISAVRTGNGALSHYVALFSDITDMRRRQDEVERLVFLDPLTGLANRRVLCDGLQQALSEAAAKDLCAAVCTVDLDGFKAVNDEHGLDAGNAVLVAVAQRLLHTVRPQDTVVRTGGDEVVVVLTALVDETEAHDVMRRALAALAEPVALPGGGVAVGASMGLVCYPRDGADAAALLQSSDAAMYRAKRIGANRIVLAQAGAGCNHGCPPTRRNA